MQTIFKGKLTTYLYDVLFLMFCLACLYFWNKYGNENRIGDLTYLSFFTISIAAMLIFIELCPIKTKEEKKVYQNKMAMIPFGIIVLWAQAITFLLDNVFGINNTTAESFNRFAILGIQVGITLIAIGIPCFFHIKLKVFHWKLTIKTFGMVFITYIIYRLICGSFGVLYVGELVQININKVALFIITAITQSFYPGIYEEVLFRGLLIAGLKGLGLDDNKTNVIQASLFGMHHILGWGSASWIFLLSTAAQALLGYVLGKIYFKTKSLSSCVLFHGLLDAITIF